MASVETQNNPLSEHPRIFDMGYDKGLYKVLVEGDTLITSTSRFSFQPIGGETTPAIGTSGVGDETQAGGSAGGGQQIFTGELIGGQLHIPSKNGEANSYHVDQLGNSWWGAEWDDFKANNDAANAYILKDGTAKFQSATIIGSITATSGAIGGFDIGTDYIRDAANSFGLASTVTVGDDVRFWAGATFANRATAPFRLTEAGVLTATSGTVGGWTLGASSLTGGSATLANTGILTLGTADDVAILDASDATYRLIIGDATYADAPFSVTKAGVLKSTSGTIGGWVIGASSLADVAGVVGLSMAVTGGDDIRFWAGDATPASAEFRVYESGALVASSATITGAITATSGTIGSFTIGTYLYTGSKTAWNDTNAGVHLGSDGIGIGNNVFTVDGSSGALVATSATITGSITATSGTIGGWTINADSIADDATEANADLLIKASTTSIRLGPTSGNYITIDGANERIRSSSYVSGPLGAGFTIEPNFAEFGDIRARGKISTSVFEKDSISAIGGQLIVANADILNADMTAADNSTVTIVGDTTFAVNDILVIGDGTDLEYMRVTNIASAPTYTVTRDLGAAYGANTNPVWKKGTAVTVFGSSDGASTYSGGWLYLKGAGTNAPYYAVVTRTGVGATAYTEYARFGELNGFLDYSSSEYGFAVGDSSDYISFDPTNSLRIFTKSTDAITIGQGGNIALKYGGDVRFSSVPEPTACTATLVVTGTGNVDNGTHKYVVTFVNDYGETDFGTGSNTVTVDASHKQVDLSSIPTSSVGDVTARKIYRSKAGDTSTFYLLTTINDNSTTTYTDNTADASLGALGLSWRNNSTFGKIIVDNKNVLSIQGSTVGNDPGNHASVAIGADALVSNVYSEDNVAIGTEAMYTSQNSIWGIAIGSRALYTMDGGIGDIGVGLSSLYSLTNGDYNIGIGGGALYAVTSGDNNVAIGVGAGNDVTTGSGNVFIGRSAGSGGETGSNKLYIENSSSSSPLIYGEFDNDFVKINGDFEVTGTATIQDATTTTKGIASFDEDSYAVTSGDVKPLMVGFWAYNTASDSLNNGDTIVCDSEVYDTGSDYNTGTGVFTAPVAGYYIFSVSVTFNPCTAGQRYGWLLTSTTTAEWYHISHANSSAYLIASDTTTPIHMGAGDTMTLSVYETQTGTATVYGEAGGREWTKWGGYLLAKD